MNLKSLGYKTDLFFARWGGEVQDRGNYTVIRTPSNPTYYCGNFLLFERPPEDGDFESWMRLFAEEIGTPPTTEHVMFGWDTPGGEAGYAQPFLDAGFALDLCVVLTTEAVHRPLKYHEEVSVRPLKEDREWEGALQNQIACREPGHALEGYVTFKARQMARYRELAQSGKGEWFGAFLDGNVVADLGVFVEDGVGRYQAVGTHPDYRRRGICGALVHQAGRYAFERLGAKTLVMVADEAYHAARIYETVGFRPTERQASLCRWPRTD